MGSMAELSEHWSSPDGCHPNCPACAAEHPERVKYANLSWTAADVQTLAAGLTDEQAVEWLENNSQHIHDRLWELGWDVIESLLSMDGIELISAEDLEYRNDHKETTE